ncbi:MAG: DUF2179 domain-containing protein [Tissierellia bacterium]|nr:DUF2179 domain-containing protein [Tissierellia bacterium]
MTYLLIFFSRICDVSLSTMRTILVVQGRKIPAAILGFFEVVIYIMILNTLMQSMDNVFNIIAYGLGFAAGNFVGISIEDKLALGYISVQIIIREESEHELTEALRKRGYGVTVLEGHGYETKNSVLIAVIGRKEYDKLRYVTKKIVPNSFITVNSIKQWTGGFFKK